MKKILFFVVLVMLTNGNSGMAQDDEMAFKTLVNVRSLKCDFSDGYIGKWEKGKIKIEPGKLGTPLHYDSIDLKEQKARIISNQGSADVSVITTLTGLTFIEITPIGNISITTVFADYKEGSRDFIAVLSRHMKLFPSKVILPSQYHGICKVWE